MDRWEIDHRFIQVIEHYLIHVPVMLGFFLKNIKLVKQKSCCHVSHPEVVWRDPVQIFLNKLLFLWVIDDVLFDTHFIATTQECCLQKDIDVISGKHASLSSIHDLVRLETGDSGLSECTHLLTLPLDTHSVGGIFNQYDVVFGANIENSFQVWNSTSHV